MFECVTLYLCRVVSNCYQVRFKRQARAQYRLQPDWFVMKKSQKKDEGLTMSNEKFIRKVIKDTYRGQDSMLKDDPWPHQEYTKVYVYPA